MTHSPITHSPTPTLPARGREFAFTSLRGATRRSNPENPAAKPAFWIAAPRAGARNDRGKVLVPIFITSPRRKPGSSKNSAKTYGAELDSGFRRNDDRRTKGWCGALSAVSFSPCGRRCPEGADEGYIAEGEHILSPLTRAGFSPAHPLPQGERGIASCPAPRAAPDLIRGLSGTWR